MSNVVNEIDAAGKKSMRTRIITAFVLLIVGGGSIFLGGYFFLAFMALVTGFGVWEFVKASNKKYAWYVYAISFIATYSVVFYGVVHSKITTGTEFLYGVTSVEIPLLILFVTLTLFFLISIFKEEFTLNDVVYLFSMVFLVGIGFQSFLFLRYFPYAISTSEQLSDSAYLYGASALLVCFCVFATYMNDGMAYFAGILFGKHKINPRISPKKTVEGFIGGWALATVITFVICIVLDICGMPLISGLLDLDHWYLVLIISLILPGIANIGDFSMSLIKRTYGIKDFGKIIVGHGGVLDRADSLIFTSAILALFIKVVISFVIV